MTVKDLKFQDKDLSTSQINVTDFGYKVSSKIAFVNDLLLGRIERDELVRKVGLQPESGPDVFSALKFIENQTKCFCNELPEFKLQGVFVGLVESQKDALSLEAESGIYLIPISACTATKFKVESRKIPNDILVSLQKYLQNKDSVIAASELHCSKADSSILLSQNFRKEHKLNFNFKKSQPKHQDQKTNNSSAFNQEEQGICKNYQNFDRSKKKCSECTSTQSIEPGMVKRLRQKFSCDDTKSSKKNTLFKNKNGPIKKKKIYPSCCKTCRKQKHSDYRKIDVGPEVKLIANSNTFSNQRPCPSACRYCSKKKSKNSNKFSKLSKTKTIMHCSNISASAKSLGNYKLTNPPSPSTGIPINFQFNSVDRARCGKPLSNCLNGIDCTCCNEMNACQTQGMCEENEQYRNPCSCSFSESECESCSTECIACANFPCNICESSDESSSLSLEMMRNINSNVCVFSDSSSSIRCTADCFTSLNIKSSSDSSQESVSELIEDDLEKLTPYSKDYNRKYSFKVFSSNGSASKRKSKASEYPLSVSSSSDNEQPLENKVYKNIAHAIHSAKPAKSAALEKKISKSNTQAMDSAKSTKTAAPKEKFSEDSLVSFEELKQAQKYLRNIYHKSVRERGRKNEESVSVSRADSLETSPRLLKYRKRIRAALNKLPSVPTDPPARISVQSKDFDKINQLLPSSRSRHENNDDSNSSHRETEDSVFDHSERRDILPTGSEYEAPLPRACLKGTFATLTKSKHRKRNRARVPIIRKNAKDRSAQENMKESWSTKGSQQAIYSGRIDLSSSDCTINSEGRKCPNNNPEKNGNQSYSLKKKTMKAMTKDSKRFQQNDNLSLLSKENFEDDSMSKRRYSRQNVDFRPCPAAIECARECPMPLSRKEWDVGDISSRQTWRNELDQDLVSSEDNDGLDDN